jgi:hypothetical protein
MPSLSLAGRVVRSTDLAPLPGVAIRLVGPAAALSGVPGARPMPAGQQITWTRQLSGFAGSRWDCWEKYLRGQVPGLTWEQFSEPALAHNPSLNPSHLFKADQTYLIPEAVAAAPYTWTRQLSGFAGSRWDCWVANVQGKVQAITWEQFRDAALDYNPQLNADGRLFKPEKLYLIPQNDASPRAFLETLADAQGQYAFTLGTTPAVFELQVEVDDYRRFVLPLAVNGAITQPVALVPQTTTVQTLAGPVATSGSVRSARPDYAALPEKVRRVIDTALFMLGDDAQVFDALPDALRKMCYGSTFLANPNDFHYKDIVCADLVSIALKAAGCDIAWSTGGNPHMADYYHPDRGSPKLVEVFGAGDLLPGDVFVFGAGPTSSRAGHVALYVGPFSGTDRSGKTYGLSDAADVVEASMDFMMNGKEVGSGVVGRNSGVYCLQQKCYCYGWVRRVRLRELAALFGR